MRNVLKILTPENVYVEYELAGLGSRFAAFCIDLLIQIGLIVLILLGMLLGGVSFRNVDQGFQQGNSLIIAVSIAIIFIVMFGYFILFELAMNGQTPGKKALKLRAIRQNGEPLGIWDSFLRNILRIADMLPSLYLAGALFIMFTRDYKRIGDFAANTVVVRVKKNVPLPALTDLLRKGIEEDEDESSAAINIYPVNNFEYGVLKEFLARADKLGGRRPVFEYHLNRYFTRKFDIEVPNNDPYELFREIVRLNGE